MGIVLLTWVGMASAAMAEVQLSIKSVGNYGAVKTGRWLPVELELSGEEGQKVHIELTCPDAHGDRVRYVSDEEFTLSSTPQSVKRSIRSGKLDGQLTVLIKEAVTQEVLATEGLLLSEASVHGDLNSSHTYSLNLTDLTEEVWQEASKRDGQTALVGNAADLLIAPNSLNAIDLIVAKPTAELSAEFSAQLKSWVQSGGRLILFAGPNHSLADSPLGDWVPFKTGEVATLPSASSIESFANDSSRISRRAAVSARILESTTGLTLLDGPVGPLIQETVYGRGTIVITGLDFDAAPLNSWSGLPVLLKRILNTTALKSANQTQSRQLSQLGINDLKTQLDFSVTAEESLAPSLWIVLGLTLVLALLIGPLDYLFCHYVCKKPELTWLTFPLFLVIAVTGCLLNYQPSSTAQRGQITFWDIDAEQSHSELTSFLSFSEPVHTRHDVQLTAANLGLAMTDPSVSLSWSGVPEQSFGGMNRTSNLAATQTAYQIETQQLSISQLPLLAQSRQVLQLQQSGTLDQPIVEASLKANAAGQLTGQFSHQLPGTLKGWVVAYGKRIYRPRDESQTFTSPLRPGEIWTPNSATVSQRELKGYLTGRTMRTIKKQNEVGEKLLVSNAIYNPLDPNPDFLSRFVTFYEACGGMDYTKLSNSELKHLDLSHQLSLNHAVLMGRLEQNPVTVEVDGAEEPMENHATYVRLLIPVERTETIIQNLPDYDKQRRNQRGRSPLRQVE